MKKTLIGILTAGTLLIGCGTERVLQGTLPTDELYESVDWITVPCPTEITSFYNGEKIAKSKSILHEYEEKVAERNGLEITERNGTRYIVCIEGKTIELPDLDKDNKVTSGKGVYSK
jgi:hypothetical protein